MTLISDDSSDYWRGWIPEQTGYFDTIFYYIAATAQNGKTVFRPMPGPAAAWPFVIHQTVSVTPTPTVQWQPIYPNPASALTVIPINADASIMARITLHDAFGRELYAVFSGRLQSGQHKYFLDARNWPSGAYFVKFQTENGDLLTQKLLIK